MISEKVIRRLGESLKLKYLENKGRLIAKSAVLPIILIIWVFYRLDLKDIAQYMTLFDGESLLVAAAFASAMALLFSLRLIVFLGFDNFGRKLAAGLIYRMYTALLPARAGEAVYPVLAARNGFSPSPNALGATITSRFMDVIIMSGFICVFFAYLQDKIPLMPVWTFFLFLALHIFLWGMLLILRLKWEGVIIKFIPSHWSFNDKLAEFINSSAKSIRGCSLSALIKIFLITLVMWTSNLYLASYLLKSFALNISMTDVGAGIALSSLMSVFPVTGLLSLDLGEATMVAWFVILGVPEALSVAVMMICWLLFVVVDSIFGVMATFYLSIKSGRDIKSQDLRCHA